MEKALTIGYASAEIDDTPPSVRYAHLSGEELDAAIEDAQKRSDQLQSWEEARAISVLEQCHFDW